MTKVQTHFVLNQPLDEELLTRIRDAQAIYGIERIQLNPAMTGLMVEYDATRLRPPEVRGALLRCGLPLESA